MNDDDEASADEASTNEYNDITLWEESTTTLQFQKAYHSAVVLPNNRILVTGGRRKTVEIIDTNGTISQASSFPMLPKTRRDHASAVIGNYAYVIGGYVRRQGSKSIIRIDINNPEKGWEDVVEMGGARGGCAVAVHNHRVYFFGGIEDSNCVVDRDGRNYRGLVDTVEVFDIRNPSGGYNTITARMNIPRANAAVIPVGNIIYIIGGVDEDMFSDRVEIFDTVTETFEFGPYLPLGIPTTSAVAIGTLIVIIGGHSDGNIASRDSYMLDTTARNARWELTKAKLRVPRRDHTTNFIGNKLYVCGGQDNFRNAFDGFRNILDSIEYILITDLIPRGTYFFCIKPSNQCKFFNEAISSTTILIMISYYIFNFCADKLQMTSLHVLCCYPNTTLDDVRGTIQTDPSALTRRDVEGKIPLQRFLLSRDVLDVTEGVVNESNNNDNGGGGQGGRLPSLLYLLESGLTSLDLDITFILNDEYVNDLLISDNDTKLFPFMSAAVMSNCGLDVVYSLAMKELEILQLQSVPMKRRKIH